MSKKYLLLCPDCQAKITIETTAVTGEVISCSDCSIDLEITNIKPVTLVHAAAVQEDWGQ